MPNNGENVQLDPVTLSKASLQKIRLIVREEMARAVKDLQEGGVIQPAATEPPPEGSGP